MLLLGGGAGIFHQAHVDSVQHQFGSRTEFQLFHDVFPVGIDRMGTEVEPAGDLLGDQPLGDQLDDLDFPGGEGRCVAEVVVAAFGKTLFQQVIQHLGAEELLSSGRRFYSV